MEQNSFFSKRSIPWVLLVCAVVVNIVLLVSRNKQAKSAEAAAAAQAPKVAAPPAAPVAPAAGPAVEWQQATLQLTSTLERTFTQALGDDLGPQVSQTYARLFVWDVNFRTELSPKDAVHIIYRELGNNEIDIAAARLQVQKRGRTLRAYKFQSAGDKYASWWNEQGVEVPMQLKASPIKDYTQVTSLVGDGRGHGGMDFKTPVGSEIVAPFAGKVLRTNWNWGANGNCLEVEFGDGTLAKFLHLSENKVKIGDTVAAGQLIALSGNTGHSTAPHLHYQLNLGAKVLDPVAYHGTTRRKLDEAAMPGFAATIQALDAQMAPKTAAL
ncbi:MAG: M23 family metallopeptidase [Myxococcales bacterium]|nr:M23 family metallopeptidase [Myxococcales bacterium]